MTLLPLTTCAQMLGIHSKTLHQWLKEANVSCAVHPSDARDPRVWTSISFGNWPHVTVARCQSSKHDPCLAMSLNRRLLRCHHSSHLSQI
jgi:hypothetical protein